MSNYYRYLNLPENPVADFFDVDQYAYSKRMLRYSQVNFPKDILKTEIIRTLTQLELDISHVVMFSKPTGRRENAAMMHSDINWEEGKQQWIKEIFGINWELTDTKTIMSWWSTSRKEIYPDTINTEILPEGVHYGSRYLLGIFPETDTRVDSLVNTKKSVLLRTDEPHTVDVLPNNAIQNRVALSVRFKNKFNNWNEVLEKLNPIII